jgi:hypothetical protein
LDSDSSSSFRVVNFTYSPISLEESGVQSALTYLLS